MSDLYHRPLRAGEIEIIRIMSLDGKIAIVTGASRGIGEAIATTLASHGATLALVARSRADLDAVATRLTTAGGYAFAFPCDLRHAHEVTQLVDTIIAQLGHIDILVNNAGATPHGNLLERDDAEWHDAYEAKIHNFVRMCRACWPYLKARPGPSAQYLRRAGADTQCECADRQHTRRRGRSASPKRSPNSAGPTAFASTASAPA